MIATSVLLPMLLAPLSLTLGANPATLLLTEALALGPPVFGLLFVL